MPRYPGFLIQILIVVFLLTGCGNESTLTDSELISRAEKNILDEKFNAALIDLKNVLQKDSSNLRARYTLGKLYLVVGDGAAAEKEFNLAIQQSSDTRFIIPLLAKAFLFQRKNQAVLDLNWRDVGSDDLRSDMLVSRGLAFLARGEADKARSSIQEALKILPDSPYALLGMARVLTAEQHYGKAREIITKILQMDERYADAWGLLGDIERIEGSKDKAESAYSKAIESKPAHDDELYKRAMLRISQQQYELAQNDIDLLKESIGDNPLIEYAQGLLFIEKKYYKEAQTAFEKVLAFNGDYMPAVLFAGFSHYFQGNFLAAEGYLDRYVDHHPDHTPAKRILGQIKSNSKNHVEAEKLARSILEDNQVDVLALTLLASALIAQDHVDETVDTLNKVVSIQPESAKSRLELAEALLRKGDREAAIKELEKAIALDPNYRQASIKLVLTHLKYKDYNKALKVAQEYHERSPGDSASSLMLGMVHLARKEHDSAVSAFQRVLEIDPGNVSANIGLAAIAMGNKEPNKAIGYYRDALKHHPGDLKVSLNLTAVQFSQGDRAGAHNTLQEAITHNPDALQPKLILSRSYLIDEPEKALGVLAGLLEQYPTNLPVLALAAEGQMKTRDFESAKITLDRLVKLDPNNPAPLFLLAQAKGSLGDRTGYHQALLKVLELDPNHVDARKNLTEMLLADQKLDEAAQHHKLLKEKAGNQVDVLILEGRLFEARGENKQAVVVYQKVLEKERTNFNLLRLTNAQWKDDQKADALNALKNWMQEYPQDAVTRFELANRYLSVGRTTDAVHEFKKVIEVVPNNYIAMNNLAWLLRDTATDEALSYAEKAVELAPQSGEFKDTLAMVLLIKKDYVRAEKVIDKALDLSPENPSINFHKAMILNELGRNGEAYEVLKDLLAKHSEFPERGEAENLIRAVKP